MITSFPGYELKNGVGLDGKSRWSNWYRGVDMGFGGYVYAQYGLYYDVALLDVASMHPTSLILLNYFGEYTPRYEDILRTRLSIKHDRLDEAALFMDGKLKKYLDQGIESDALAYALKIFLNSQYGLSSSHFDMPQVDKRNVNNIVALRGALFMKTLQDAVTEQGYQVAHVKTDSIKIPNADPGIIKFVTDFGHDYGYTFEHEATFEKMCLITDADYIAKYKWAEKAKKIGTWSATGAQFAHPYVFKTLFSREPIEFDDYCETKAVKSAIYLNMNESGEDDRRFIGRIGRFCPIKKGRGGGELLRENGEKFAAVTGTKGYRWLEANYVKEMHKEDDIDFDYFVKMADDMYNKIGEYGDPEFFCSSNHRIESEMIKIEDEPTPLDCGELNCTNCEHLDKDGYHSDCGVGIDNSAYLISKDE